MNQVSGRGWKSDFDCHRLAGEQLIKCIEEISYSASDIFILKDDYIKPIYENDKIIKLFLSATKQTITVTPVLTNGFSAMAYYLTLDNGVISSNLDATLNLHLNNNLSYWFRFADPKLLINSPRPDTVPCLNIKKSDNLRHVYVLKVPTINNIINLYCQSLAS